MLNLLYEWAPFIKYGQLMKVEPTTVIYRQGETGKGFFYLHKGEVKITLLSNTGDERIINIVPSGMLFGEHGVQQEPYLTSAITTTDAEIYVFSDEALMNLYHHHPEAIELYTDSLIYKFRVLAEIIEQMDRPVEQQMAYYLIKLLKENGTVPLHQTALAKYIGTSRVTVNKTLKKWKEQGIINVKNRKIEVLELEKINEIAEKNL